MLKPEYIKVPLPTQEMLYITLTFISYLTVEADVAMYINFRSTLD